METEDDVEGDVPPEMFSPTISAVPPIAPSVVNSASPTGPG